MQILSSIRLPAKLENLYKFMNSVSQCAKGQGFTQKRINEIELALEEALVNIFKYAYQDNNGDVEITCFIDNGERFTIDIIDSGIPFNMLSYKEPDLTSDISGREIGGLGVFIMKKLIDNIQYSRENEKNISRFVILKK